LNEQRVAQILQQHQAVGGPGVKDARRRQAKARKVPGDAQEIRRVVAGAGRAVHQHCRPARKAQPFIAPGRGIAGQVRAVGVAPAGSG
jgi:hypothetical protein